MAYLDDIGFQNWAVSRGAKMHNDGDHDLGLYHEQQLRDNDNGLDPGKVNSGAYEKELRKSYETSESVDAQGRKRFGTEGTQFGDTGGFFSEDRISAVDTAAGKKGVRVGEDADDIDAEGLREQSRKVYDAYKSSGRELGWYDDKFGYAADPEFWNDFQQAAAADNQKAQAGMDMLPMIFAAVVTAGVASLGAAGVAAAEGAGATAGAGGAVGSSVSPFSTLYSEALAGTGPFASGAAGGAAASNVSPFTNLYSEAVSGTGPFAPATQAPGIVSQVQGAAPETAAPAGDFSQSFTPGPLEAPPTGLPQQLPPIENPISPSLLNPELAPQIPLAPNVDPSTGLMGAAANNAPPSLFERITDAAMKAPTSAAKLLKDNPGTALTAASLLAGASGGGEEPKKEETPTTPPMDQNLGGVDLGVRRSSKGLTDLQGRPIFDQNGRLNTGIISRARAA